MKKIFVHKNEFCTIEEDGVNISIIYGYTDGIAVVQRFIIKVLLVRKFILSRYIKDYKKRGFKKAGTDFKPEPTASIYLEDYQLPESRYCENTETNHFFEVGLVSGYLYIREGQIDGLGTIKRYKFESGDNPQAAVNERDHLINTKLNQGYVERYTGGTYSLSVIASEYEAKQKARGTAVTREEELWLEEKKLQREYEAYLNSEQWKALAAEAAALGKTLRPESLTLAGWPEPDMDYEIKTSREKMEHAPFILAVFEDHYNRYWKHHGYQKPVTVEVLLEMVSAPYIRACGYRSGDRELWAYVCAPGGNWNGFIVDRKMKKVAGLVSDATFSLISNKFVDILTGRRNISRKPGIEGQPEFTKIAENDR